MKLYYFDCKEHSDTILHISLLKVYINPKKITFYVLAPQSAVSGHHSSHCCFMLFPGLIWKNPLNGSQDAHYIGLRFLLGFITRCFCHILFFFSLKFHEVITFFLWKYWLYLITYIVLYIITYFNTWFLFSSYRL